ncbi:glutathione S-transferase N-terminal domain-containing protein [uncultured Ferrimonas sp.]|uniref:glutathione S-transferase N-terminal domain-containing protein n=1 Tax=uncultured Ferrimonas sp. TaxID=432640 RepID=UPI0026279C39|nr:glutathione S-transferase N-terminal domain-containing protein [uncultured Ferrimonas sp.]
MILYFNPASPHCRVVRLLARYLEVELEELSLAQEQHAQLLRRSSPLGLAPCLLTDAGSLYDHGLICRFLDDRFGDGHFHRRLAGNWNMAKLATTLSGLMDSAVQLQHEKRREAPQSSELQRHLLSLQLGLGLIRESLNHFPKTTSIFSLRLLALLDYLDGYHPECRWREQQHGLVAWQAQQQDEFTQAVPAQ